MTAQIAPSILSADFGRLADQIAAAEAGGAGLIHVDVMDGHFVPNITIGPLIVTAVRRATRLPVDCHLMVEAPDSMLEAFCKEGADMISVHQEAVPHLQRTVSRIRELGARPGVVINPATPVSTLEDILRDVDYVLVMSVNPGFGGQKFLPQSLDKLRRLRAMIEAQGLSTHLEIDGGVGESNVRSVVEAGAEWIVAGSAVFGAGDGKKDATHATQRLNALANGQEPG